MLPDRWFIDSTQPNWLACRPGPPSPDHPACISRDDIAPGFMARHEQMRRGVARYGRVWWQLIA
ncbi:hypothetical protein [Komagataeibacter sp. NFXK3]